ncbi:MAG: cation transporter [Elusimicrobia bacterium CG08_land_8_20_14_0_20_51_18]|nr:MAG: cation transporter [Elusimicrobia bacterium CG08_land_8_20_14_0_20_51_18]
MEYFPVLGLVAVLLMTLALPFSVKIIEEEIEIFLFTMGILSVSISRMWSWHLILEALKEPIPITLTVLAMGLLFKFTRKKLAAAFRKLQKRIRPDFLVFSLVLLLGFLSSVITAIIAAILLSEIVTVMKFKRTYEIRLVVLACFAIGIGAALTPLGEPLSTIIVAKLKGEPHNADFFYLLKNLGEWIVPGVVLFALIAAAGARGNMSGDAGLSEDFEESNKTIFFRAAKVFLFVMALIFLGKGISPLSDKFAAKMPVEGLFWVNSISAVLDNATLAAAEIVPSLSDRQVTFIVMGLIISGGMLIPGNIPNIISSSKLNIKSREWARVGLPYGAAFMIIYFLVLYFLA